MLDVTINFMPILSTVRKETGKMKPDSRESSSSRKRSKPNPKEDESISRKPRKIVEVETDPTVLQRRQKHIDYGKNTVGYHNYIRDVPREQRSKEDPKTPDKYSKYSRRSWDALIKIWRIKLHHYDPNSDTNSKAEEKSEVDSE